MSISQCVVCRRDQLPSVSTLEARARQLGFDLRVDPADLSTHTGFLPAVLDGEPAGFEWSIDDTSICDDLGIDTGGRDCVCSLTTQSSEREGQSAMICVAALLELTGGIYFDEYENVDTDSERLVSEVRQWMGLDEGE